MLKSVQWILERIAERIVPVVAASFASVIEGVLAVGRAEQQSQLEDAARKYDEEGKPEIAATLRRQVARLSSSNPAAQALEIQQHLAGDQLRIGQSDAPAGGGELGQLPDFSAGGAAKPRRKKRHAGDPNEQQL